MGVVGEYVTTLFALPLELPDAAESLRKSLRKNDEKILDLNRQQLDRGRDATGGSLGRYRSFKYKGRWEPIDLKLKGDFRGKLTLEVGKNESNIFSQDQKAGVLEKRYGKDIYGVPVPFLPNVQEIILDDFVIDYQRQLLR